MQTGPQNMPSFPDSTHAGAEEEGHHRVPQTRSTATRPRAPAVSSWAASARSAEGLFGWIFGLGALIAVAVWVAARTAKAKKS